MIDKKRGSTFVIKTLENLHGFLIIFTYPETGINALCKKAIYLFILHVMQIWHHCHIHYIDEL